MAHTVWKQTLKIADRQEIQVPKDSTFILVREQYDEISIWFRCDPYAERESRLILIRGTGQQADENWNYLGSAVLSEGKAVFHIFEMVS